MLNINKSSNSTLSDLWKVLILDDYTQKILSTLMKVNELREHGITVHLYYN